MNLIFATDWITRVSDHWKPELKIKAIDTALWNLREWQATQNKK